MRTDDPPKLVVGCGAELSTKSKIEGLLRKECHLDTVLAGKVTVIPNAVDVEKFTVDNPPDAQLKATLGLTQARVPDAPGDAGA